jgi:hypothetical protein
MQFVVKQVGSGLGSGAGKNVRISIRTCSKYPNSRKSGFTAQTFGDKLDFLQTNNVLYFSDLFYLAPFYHKVFPEALKKVIVLGKIW